MSGFESLLTLWLIYMGVALSPGVNFALIGQTATRYARREALLVAAGVVTASAVWMTAALVGLVALAERAGSVFGFIRIAAGLYLVMLGVQKIRHREPRLQGELSGEATKSGWRHYADGFATGMGNPKAILFFGTLFATAFPSDASAMLRVAGAALVLVSSIAVHAGLASILSIGSVRAGYLRARRIVDPIFGLVFIGFGVRLIRTDP